MLKDVVLCFIDWFVIKEFKFRLQEEAHRPQPFWSLVVVVTLTRVWIHIVSIVVTIRRVECFYSQCTLLHKKLFDNSQALFGSWWCKQLRGNSHSNTKVWPKLIVSELVCWSVDVFVNATSVDKLLLDVACSASVASLVFRNVETLFEAFFDLFWPLFESHLSYASEFELALLVQLGKIFQNRISKSYQFNWGAVSWCGWDSFVCRCRTHLVHPRPAVILVATKNESCVPISFDLNVKAIILHLCINLHARVPFSKLNAISMRLKNLHN